MRSAVCSRSSGEIQLFDVVLGEVGDTPQFVPDRRPADAVDFVSEFVIDRIAVHVCTLAPENNSVWGPIETDGDDAARGARDRRGLFSSADESSPW